MHIIPKRSTCYPNCPIAYGYFHLRNNQLVFRTWYTVCLFWQYCCIESGHLFIIISLTNVNTLYSYMSLIFSRFMLLLISSVGVILYFLNKSFNSLFCMICILLVFWTEHLPYISIPYLILKYINAKYNSLAILLVIRYFTLLKIPKYLMSDLLKKSTLSLNGKVSSNIKPKYWNYFTLLIVMLFVTISFRFRGIGLLCLTYTPQIQIVEFWRDIRYQCI